MSARKVATADPREAYVELNASRHLNELPAKAVEDLKYFATRASEGRPITVEALLAWMREHYGIEIGRSRLATLARTKGITPWWKP